MNPQANSREVVAAHVKDSLHAAQENALSAVPIRDLRAHQQAFEVLARALGSEDVAADAFRPNKANEFKVTDEMQVYATFCCERGITFLERLKATMKQVVELEEQARQITGAMVPVLRQTARNLVAELVSEARQDPDAYRVYFGNILEGYCRNLEEGRLVRTPHVEKALATILDRLHAGKPVFIHGDTGGGKTEIARLAAKAYSGKEPYVVRGHPGMSSEEMFGHMALTKSKLLEAAHVVDLVQRDIAAWRQENPTAREQDSKRAADIITQRHLAERSTTTSEYILGAVYKAFSEGRVVIIDEANYIPPGLLAKLNDILTKQEGELVDVPEAGIEAIARAKGFGIIFTGNVNYDQMKARYGHRHELDLALLDRAAFLKYEYLEQAIEGTANLHPANRKQLFAIAVAAVLDSPRKDVAEDSAVSKLTMTPVTPGDLFLPGGEEGLDLVWRFAQFARMTQMAFAGVSKENDLSFKSGNVQYSIQTKVALTPRNVISILQDWKREGFQRELDTHIYNNLIERSLVARDRAYLYQLARYFGFFQSQGWEQNPDYGDRGEVHSFNVTCPDNMNTLPTKLVHGDTVLEAVFTSMPQRTEWPSGSPSVWSERRAHQKALSKAIADVEACKAEFKEFLEMYPFLAEEENCKKFPGLFEKENLSPSPFERLGGPSGE